jgi:uncharacterized membrane protein YfcA
VSFLKAWLISRACRPGRLSPISPSSSARGGGTTQWTTIRNRILDGFIGLLGGIFGGLASVSGPIMTVWCQFLGWSKDEQRGTYQPYNFAMHVFAITAFGFAGLLTKELCELTLISLPVTFACMWLGRRMYDLIEEAGFLRITLVLLTASGMTLIWAGLNG